MMLTTRGESPLSCSEGRGRNSRGTETGASNFTAIQDNSDPRVNQLMEEVLSKENMTKAVKRVEANKGAAGVDEMTVSELKGYLKQEWPRIRGELLEGRYLSLIHI